MFADCERRERVGQRGRKKETKRGEARENGERQKRINGNTGGAKSLHLSGEFLGIFALLL